MFVKNARILITGAGGLLGHGIIQALNWLGREDLRLLRPSRQEVDCLEYASVEKFFQENSPDYVIHLAAGVFGLKGNLDNQLGILSKNSIINHNILVNSAKIPVKKIFFAGSVASYSFPYAILPLKEEHLLDSYPHWGEFGYAMSKIHALAYLKILENDYSMPFTFALFTNLYGPYARFNKENGHVIPSLICKAISAVKENRPLPVWGTPGTTRDFLHSHDAGIAAILAFRKFDGIINIASGTEVKMERLARVVADNFGLKDIEWQVSRPVGIPRRSVDIGRLKNLGFEPQYDLETGIADTVAWVNNNPNLRT